MEPSPGRCKDHQFQESEQRPCSFFDMENKLCYCTNISDLFMSLGLPHNPSDWHLFIYSSKRSLKAVLLHNGNKYLSIPIAHTAHLKESYDNMELLLETIKYEEYQWSLCRIHPDSWNDSKKNSNESDTKKRGLEMGNIYRLVEFNSGHREQRYMTYYRSSITREDRSLYVKSFH